MRRDGKSLRDCLNVGKWEVLRFESARVVKLEGWGVVDRSVSDLLRRAKTRQAGIEMTFDATNLESLKLNLICWDGDGPSTGAQGAGKTIAATD